MVHDACETFVCANSSMHALLHTALLLVSVCGALRQLLLLQLMLCCGCALLQGCCARLCPLWVQAAHNKHLNCMQHTWESTPSAAPLLCCPHTALNVCAGELG